MTRFVRFRNRYPRLSGWLFDDRGYRDLWLLLISGIATWAVLLSYSTSAQNRDSLCALRHDLERRVESGERFLRKHPDGAFGLTAQEIRVSIGNQQRTISALRGLDCPPRK